MHGGSPATVDALFLATARIHTDLTDGTDLVGTGFVVERPLPDGKHCLWLVTNRHIVEPSSESTIVFIAGSADANSKILLGHRCSVPLPSYKEAWFAHPDEHVDLAVCQLWQWIDRLGPDGCTPVIRWLPHTSLATNEHLGRLESITPVVFIGYPDGRFDTETLLPLARHGYTASLPRFDFDARPMFVIDSPVFQGSSGSPVFLVEPHGFVDAGGNTVEPRSLVLGVVAAMMIERKGGEAQMVDVPRGLALRGSGALPLNFGGVVKAPLVLDTIDEAIKAWLP